MDGTNPRRDLARRIAGEITLSTDPGATIRKWRTDFDVSQTELADALDVSSSVVESRGGDRIRQYARVVSAGFESDIVSDLREYETSVPLARLYDAIDATEIQPGDTDRVSGHTVINSIAAITKLSSEEFYRLYGQSTNRALVFTDITRGESPLVAQRVVTPTPNAVVLHGLTEDDLWEHAPTLAAADGFSLAITQQDADDMVEALRALP
jgi:putative transcriptional regulator